MTEEEVVSPLELKQELFLKVLHLKPHIIPKDLKSFHKEVKWRLSKPHQNRRYNYEIGFMMAGLNSSHYLWDGENEAYTSSHKCPT